MKVGDTIEILEGPFAGEVGTIHEMSEAGDRISGPGFDLTLSESQASTVCVKIYGGVLGVFVNRDGLRVIEN